MEAAPTETSFEVDSIEQVSFNEDSILPLDEENTPKLFSEDSSFSENDTFSKEPEQKLFSQENNQEEDFEIPAFLRRQKF